MERRRSQKSQMRANVSEQSVVLDSGARVPESEVKIGCFKLENEKQKRIYQIQMIEYSSSISFHISGGRWLDGCLDEHCG